MLVSIRIRNLALIDDLEIGLGPGLSVLTGETGAGKSIIVGALNLVLGDRARADVIRSGVDEAEVEALFRLPLDGFTQNLLSEMDLSEGDGSLVVRRIVSRKGRNRVYLNGRLATLSHLKRVVGPLVDISSQHAHTSLLKVPEHRAILDRFGSLASVLETYEAAYSQWRVSVDSLRELVTAAKDRTERLDFLAFQLREFEQLDPQPGEEADLVLEREQLRHASELREAASTTERSLYSGSSAIVDTLTDVERALRSVAEVDAQLGLLADRVESARVELEDVGLEARQYEARVRVNPDRLSVVEERISALRRLMRKHGPELEDDLARFDTIRAELQQLSSYDEHLTELQAEEVQHKTEAERAGRALTDARRAAARRVSRAVVTQLADLGMPNARFQVKIEPLSDLSATGLDRVEFVMSSNVGEELLPLAKVASGGELSRIMLGLKHVLATADTVDCYVFDEVDTGVSGAIAERIGVKLRETAAQRQVLSITHLPQVACQADSQLRVHKEVEDGRTVTRVSTLEHAERVEEIARLLAGVQVTEPARAHAAEMLASAVAS